jgi:hypothetical protein
MFRSALSCRFTSAQILRNHWFFYAFSKSITEVQTVTQGPALPLSYGSAGDGHAGKIADPNPPILGTWGPAAQASARSLLVPLRPGLRSRVDLSCGRGSTQGCAFDCKYGRPWVADHRLGLRQPDGNRALISGGGALARSATMRKSRTKRSRKAQNASRVRRGKRNDAGRKATPKATSDLIFACLDIGKRPHCVRAEGRNRVPSWSWAAILTRRRKQYAKKL